jgi:hypothetical protein
MSQRKRDFITRKYHEYTGTVADFSVMVNWYSGLFWEV